MLAYVLCLILPILLSPVVVGGKSKCYLIFGSKECFSASAPFTNTLRKLPESPGKQRVRFVLYTPENPTTPQHLDGSNRTSIASSRLNSKKTVRVIIHGFRDRVSKPWVKSMARELLRNDGSNVIVVDWRNGALKPYWNYLQAAANTRVVGAILAKMIQIISANKQIPYNRFHLIGHSLGAHIAGYAGRRLSGKIGRISGLDPAGPGFEKSSPPVRLDKTDAMFVDVIHTDGDKLVKGGAGIQRASGDADFYPNGGKNQPGCSHKFFDHLKNLFRGPKAFKIGLGCDHLRVLDLYRESINTGCSFRACGVSGCSRMGFHAVKDKKGSFSLITNSKSKFCKV